jgi:hypothetical protein
MRILLTNLKCGKEIRQFKPFAGNFLGHDDRIQQRTPLRTDGSDFPAGCLLNSRADSPSGGYDPVSLDFMFRAILPAAFLTNKNPGLDAILFIQIQSY